MTEEQVTKAILQYLTIENWNIIAYDFPQSGTGKVFYSTIDGRAIIPDIICIKGNECMIFENKNRYYKPDFEKLATLKETGEYNNGIFNFIKRNDIIIKTAVGMPKIEHVISEMEDVFRKVEYVYFVKNNGEIVIENY